MTRCAWRTYLEVDAGKHGVMATAGACYPVNLRRVSAVKFLKNTSGCGAKTGGAIGQEELVTNRVRAGDRERSAPRPASPGSPCVVRFPIRLVEAGLDVVQLLAGAWNAGVGVGVGLGLAQRQQELGCSEGTNLGWRGGLAEGLRGGGRGGEARDFGGGASAEGFVVEGAGPQARGLRVLERPLVDDGDDRFVAGGTGGYVGEDEARGGEGIGFGAEVGEVGQGVIAPGVGRLFFGPVVSRVEITRGPLHDKAGEQSGVVGGELVFQGEIHRRERIGLRGAETAAHQLQADGGGG
jgi:hypothetical protein